VAVNGGSTTGIWLRARSCGSFQASAAASMTTRGLSRPCERKSSFCLTSSTAYTVVRMSCVVHAAIDSTSSPFSAFVSVSRSPPSFWPSAVLWKALRHSHSTPMRVVGRRA
jgi:hypothetical protein